MIYNYHFFYKITYMCIFFMAARCLKSSKNIFSLIKGNCYLLMIWSCDKNSWWNFKKSTPKCCIELRYSKSASLKSVDRKVLTSLKAETLSSVRSSNHSGKSTFPKHTWTVFNYFNTFYLLCVLIMTSKYPLPQWKKNKFIQTKFERKHTIFTMNIKFTFVFFLI